MVKTVKTVKKKLNVLCLFGGNSTEYEVSCRSFNSIIKNIDIEKFDITRVGIDKNGAWNVYEGSNENIANLEWVNDRENLYPCVIVPKSSENAKSSKDIKNIKENSGNKNDKKAYLLKLPRPYPCNDSPEAIYIDVILPVIHGANGEDGTIQGLAKLYEVPCAGADITGSVCSFDKSITKILCGSAGIKQGNYIFCRRYEFDADAEKIMLEAESVVKYPMFIKPSGAGSSIGISKAKDRTELTKAINNAFEYDSKIIIEEFINGKEIELAVLGNPPEITISCCGEIDPNAEFYDYDTKYVNDTAKYFIPARLDKDISEKVRETAKKVYMTVGAGGFARVDFFVTPDNDIYFNEINTIPGFTDISMYAKLMTHENMTYKELITKIIELAL